jgi:hypothetical protein
MPSAWSGSSRRISERECGALRAGPSLSKGKVHSCEHRQLGGLRVTARRTDRHRPKLLRSERGSACTSHAPRQSSASPPAWKGLETLGCMRPRSFTPLSAPARPCTEAICWAGCTGLASTSVSPFREVGRVRLLAIGVGGPLLPHAGSGLSTILRQALPRRIAIFMVRSSKRVLANKP